MMGAGLMVERVALDRPVSVTLADGGTEDGWEEIVAQCSARFQWLRGGETVQASRLAGRQPVVATVHRQAGLAAITPSWRLRDLKRGQSMNIRATVPTDDGQYLELTGEFGVAA